MTRTTAAGTERVKQVVSLGTCGVPGVVRVAGGERDRTTRVNGDDTMEYEATARSLTEMVDYQAGSVVSKTLIGKDTGTVTLFAFDKGQGLSEHTAPFDALVCVLDGEAEITIDGTPAAVSAGEMLIMPANKPHALTAAERFKMMLIMIKS